MSVRNPEVIEGARGPRDERTAKATAGTPRGAGLDQIPADKRIFQSTARKYRLQLTAPEDQRLPDGRIQRGAPPLRADFDESMLVLSTKNAKHAEMIKLLDESPYNVANGGSEFWDFQSVLDKMTEQRRKQAVEVLSNPTDREAIIEALRAEGIDFDLPKRKGSTPAA